MVHFLKNNDNRKLWTLYDVAFTVRNRSIFSSREYDECQIDGMMFWVLFPVDVLILAFAHVSFQLLSHTSSKHWNSNNDCDDDDDDDDDMTLWRYCISKIENISKRHAEKTESELDTEQHQMWDETVNIAAASYTNVHVWLASFSYLNA